MVQIVRDAVRQCRLISENKRLSALVQKQNEELKEWNSNLKSRVLGQTAAIRIKNDELLALNEKMKKSYEDTLTAFSGLIELRDQETKNHSRNVARISVMVAEQLHLSSAEIEVIRVASLLHDIGKIGVSDRLLQVNADGVNLDGIVEYRQHVIRGQTAIDAIEDLRPAGLMIRHHHENFDGSGFPDHLAGKEIPIGARIIALADYFDRSLSRNCGANDVEMTLKTVNTGLKRRFDPVLYPLLEKAVIEIFGKPQNKCEMVKIEILPKDLLEGMVIAREVRSGAGLLLLCAGECLDMVQIQALRHYHVIDPPQSPLLVRVNSSRGRFRYW
jgi:putative nucleotidyltransferase with HDIG domain